MCPDLQLHISLPFAQGIERMKFKLRQKEVKIGEYFSSQDERVQTKEITSMVEEMH